MINLFNVNDYVIDTAILGNHLHGGVVEEFENSFASYVGAKYACSLSSATNAIFLSLLNEDVEIKIPSIIPPVVLNAIINSGNAYSFTDNIDWVGTSYTLHDFGDYKIIDSAQRVDRNQYRNEANDSDVMIFSFYPTKPVGSIDGGIIVSNDYEKISWFKEASLNGMCNSQNNWDRRIKFPGWKMYMNSVQADIALRNLKKLDDKKNSLEEICETYNEYFCLHNTSHHLYRINIKNRKEFMIRMQESGIMCGIHYAATHLNPVYATSSCVSFLKKSEKCHDETVSIPYHEMLNKQNIDRILELTKQFAVMADD